MRHLTTALFGAGAALLGALLLLLVRPHTTDTCCLFPCVM